MPRLPRTTRIRHIKPEFFKHEQLYDLEAATNLPVRLGLIGLWCCCDREGRFEWAPRRLKSDILPYENTDFGDILDALAKGGFVVKYEAEDKVYGYIPTFHRHQVISPKEAQSTLPAPPALEGEPSQVAADSCTGREPTGLGKDKNGLESSSSRSKRKSISKVEGSTPSTSSSESQAQQLSLRLFELLDRPKDKLEAISAWEVSAATLLARFEFSELEAAMQWALRDDPNLFWHQYIHDMPKFAEKAQTIIDQYRANARRRAKGKKSKAAESIAACLTSTSQVKEVLKNVDTEII